MVLREFGIGVLIWGGREGGKNQIIVILDPTAMISPFLGLRIGE